MAFDLDDSNDNLVEFDDVIVRYDRGLADAEPDAVQKARARARLRADTEVNGDDIKSVAARTVDLESRADTAQGERQNQADALRNVEATADTQNDTLDSLSRDQLELVNRVADTERDAEANSQAIEETRSQTVINRDEIRSTAGRLTDYQASVGAINLITPPGKTVSPATKDVANARATESVKAEVTEQGNMLKSVAENAVAISGEVESLDSAQRATATALDSTNLDVQRQGDTLTNHGERLQTLDTEYADQQGQIATKASQARVDEVESSAQGARSSLATDLRAEFNSALDGQDFSNYATLNELAKVEADAESARSQLQTTLSSQIGDNTAFIQNTAETVDGISAQQVFKVSAGGAIAGLGLATGPTGDDGVTQSRIRFYANQFAFITDDADGSPSFPVTIQGSKAMLNTALIGEAQITDAMIRNLAANKIVADELSAISGNMGTLTAGTIVCGATDGVGGRVVLDGDSEYAIWAGSGGRSAQNANFYLTRNGDAIANNIRARGDIEATSIKADSANIVSTLMLQGDAVTIPLGDSNDSRTSINSTNWKTLASVYIKASDFQYAKTVMVFVGADFDLQYIDILNGPSGGTELQTRLIKEEKKYFDMDLDVLTPGSILKRPFSTARMINVGNSSGYLYLQARMSSYKQGMNFDALNRYIALLGLKDG